MQLLEKIGRKTKQKQKHLPSFLHELALCTLHHFQVNENNLKKSKIKKIE